MLVSSIDNLFKGTFENQNNDGNDLHIKYSNPQIS